MGEFRYRSEQDAFVLGYIMDHPGLCEKEITEAIGDELHTRFGLQGSRGSVGPILLTLFRDKFVTRHGKGTESSPYRYTAVLGGDATAMMNQSVTGLEEFWEMRLEGKAHSPVDKILESHLPNVVALFRSKARDYSDREGAMAADLLGSAGQFAEIWRKIPKLKKGMWDKQKLDNETVPEILKDIIGHCLLALDTWEREQRKNSDPNKLTISPGFVPGITPNIYGDSYDQHGIGGQHLG